MRRAAARITLLVLFLACGAIVNVAVAWVCAVRAMSDRTSHRMHFGLSRDIEGIGEWHVNTVAVLGSTHVLSQAHGYDDSDIRQESDYGEVYTLTAEGALPWWCPWLRPTPPLGPMEGYDMRAFAHGWPMRSMIHVWTPGAASSATRGLGPITVHGVPQWMRGRHRGMPQTGPARLPLQPMWIGFVVNSVFFAAVIWLVFVGLFSGRRALRRKRRLCERCAYPIGVSPVCTECGAAVRQVEGGVSAA